MRKLDKNSEKFWIISNCLAFTDFMHCHRLYLGVSNRTFNILECNSSLSSFTFDHSVYCSIAKNQKSVRQNIVTSCDNTYINFQHEVEEILEGVVLMGKKMGRRAGCA